MVSKLQVLSSFFTFSALFAEISTIDHITGRAELGQYPSTLAILEKENNSWALVGSGTLLHPNYALGRDPGYRTYKDVYILAGGVEWAKVDCETCQLRKISHTLSSRRAVKDSVPILMYRVENPFVRTDEVKFIKATYEKPKHGWIVHVAGFGRSNESDYWSSSTLNWNTFTVSPLKNCTDYDETMWSNYFCVYNKTKHRSDFIKSDYGAPVFYRDKVLGLVMPLNKTLFLYQTVVKLRPYKDWLAEGVAWDGNRPNLNAIDANAISTHAQHRRKKRSGSHKRKPDVRIHSLFVVICLIYPMVE